jgi:hypothetical protein
MESSGRLGGQGQSMDSNVSGQTGIVNSSH